MRIKNNASALLRTDRFEALLPVRAMQASLAVRRYETTIRAAEVLALTPSAVSRLIAQLEGRIGFALFHRDKKRLIVTTTGELFLIEVERSLGSMLRLKDYGRELGSQRAGLLRIVAMPSLAYPLLPRAVVALRRKRPNVRIHIDIRSRTDFSGIADFASYDFGLASLPVSIDGVRSELLGDLDAVCVMPARHPLTARPVITVRDLANEQIVTTRDRSLLVQRTAEAFERSGLPLNEAIVAGSSQMALEFVEAGLGIALLHGLPAGSGEPRRVSVRPLSPAITLSYAFVLPETRVLSPQAEELQSEIRESFKALWPRSMRAATKPRRR